MYILNFEKSVKDTTLKDPDKEPHTHTHTQRRVLVKYLWRTYPTEPLGSFKTIMCV